MFVPAAEIVEWDKLLQVLYTGVAAGVGVSVVFGVGIWGMTRAADMVRARRDAAGILLGVVGVAAMVAVAAAIVLGIVIMTDK